MKIITRDVPPRAAWTLEQSGVHPLLARLFAARGIASPDELDDALGRLLPPESLKGAREAAVALADAVSANQRLYVNKDDGFIGLNWRQHEFVTECTILDNVLCIMQDGSLKVTKVADKVFMGREIMHIAIWPKGIWYFNAHLKILQL